MSLKRIRIAFLFLCATVVVNLVLLRRKYNNDIHLCRGGRTLGRCISVVRGHREPQIYDHRTDVARSFTRMKYEPIFIFGVAGGNSSANSTWDHFRIYMYGVLDKTVYEKEIIRCCLMYRENGKIVTLQSETMSEIRFYATDVAMWGFHVGCPNVKHAQGLIPVGLALTLFSNVTCSENHVTFIQPYFPFIEPEKIVIGSKFAYGNVSAELIIELIEAMKYIGVDKIVTYYLRTLNADALNVLQHYASEGIVDLYFHELANEDVYPRVDHYDAPRHEHQLWNDENIVVFDSLERNSGCRYFAIIDYDIFFIPRKYRTFREMFEGLEQVHSRIAGFMLKSLYFYLSWGKSSNKSDLFIGTYTMREDRAPRFERPKSFQIPARVAIGGTETHTIKVADGHKMYHLPTEVGYIRHYRHCRRENYNECMTNIPRVLDTEVLDWANGFKENVSHVRKLVLGL